MVNPSAAADLAVRLDDLSRRVTALDLELTFARVGDDLTGVAGIALGLVVVLGALTFVLNTCVWPVLCGGRVKRADRLSPDGDEGRD